MRRVVAVLLLATLPASVPLHCYSTHMYDYTNAYEDPDSDKALLICEESDKSCGSYFKQSALGDDSDGLNQFCSSKPCVVSPQLNSN